MNKNIKYKTTVEKMDKVRKKKEEKCVRIMLIV